jgi:ABC-2 type transport system permease protein
MQGLAHANPLYYAVLASRDLAQGTIISATVLVGFVVMLGLATLTVWWATRTYRRAIA